MLCISPSNWCGGGSFRKKCLIIGYLNLIASVVDIGCHLLIVAIISNGFQCDVDKDSLELINWPWLEPILLILNLGTHGFYPYPLILRPYAEAFDYLPISKPRCYPGMLHIHLVDVMNFLINITWLKFVLAYVAAVHRKQVEPMRMFYMVSVLKLMVQTIYFAYQPGSIYFSNDAVYFIEGSAFIKVLDIGLGCIFLVVISRHIKELMQQRAARLTDQPPTYVECLINALRKDEKKEAIINVETDKTEVTSS